MAVSALCLLPGPAIYGQEAFRYQFSLQGVTDPAAAKEVTDILRPVFNTDDAPFVTFPWFRDEQDRFEFTCQLAVTREELESALAVHGIVLGEFGIIPFKVEPETEEQ